MRRSFTVAKFFPVMQPSMASLARTALEAHGNSALATDKPDAAYELVTGHGIRTDMYDASNSWGGRSTFLSVDSRSPARDADSGRLERITGQKRIPRRRAHMVVIEQRSDHGRGPSSLQEEIPDGQ